MLQGICVVVFDHGEVTVQAQTISPGAGTFSDRQKDTDTMWIFAGLEQRQPGPMKWRMKNTPQHILCFSSVILGTNAR